MEIAKVYALDAVFDNIEDVPEDVTLTRILFLYVVFDELIDSCSLFYINIY